MKFISQKESNDCAAACIAMLLTYNGKKCMLEDVKPLFEFSKNGVSIQELLDVANELKLEAKAVYVKPSQLDDLPFPAILYWKRNHFLVLERMEKDQVYLMDPAFGKCV